MPYQKPGVPAFLKNDANVCALAEWRFGAGLILEGKLYSGASGMAGEAGHIRLSGKGHNFFSGNRAMIPEELFAKY